MTWLKGLEQGLQPWWQRRKVEAYLHFGSQEQTNLTLFPLSNIAGVFFFYIQDSIITLFRKS